MDVARIVIDMLFKDVSYTVDGKTLTGLFAVLSYLCNGKPHAGSTPTERALVCVFVFCASCFSNQL